jgi:hypothetical protein
MKSIKLSSRSCRNAQLGNEPPNWGVTENGCVPTLPVRSGEKVIAVVRPSATRPVELRDGACHVTLTLTGAGGTSVVSGECRVQAQPGGLELLVGPSL